MPRTLQCLTFETFVCIRCLEPFLPLYDHFEFRRFLGINWQYQLKPCHNHFFVLTFTLQCYTIQNSFVLILLWMSAFLNFSVSTSSNFCHLQNMSPLNILFSRCRLDPSFLNFLLFSTFLTYVTICVADQMQKCHQVASERLHCWWKGLEA